MIRALVRRVTALTQAGVRRRLGVDLAEAVAGPATEIAAAVAEVAALPEEKRRGAGDTGLLAPHWPAPYGRGTSPAEQLLIDQNRPRPR